MRNNCTCPICGKLTQTDFLSFLKHTDQDLRNHEDFDKVRSKISERFCGGEGSHGKGEPS